MRSAVLLLAVGAVLFGCASMNFVNAPAANPRTSRSVMEAAKLVTTGTGKKVPAYGERDPLPKGYGIRTGLSDLLKPLNSEYGVTAKEDSVGTYVVLFLALVLLFLFYTLLLLINNQSVLLPPEDEFDEYVANFLPYFFFGEK